MAKGLARRRDRREVLYKRAPQPLRGATGPRRPHPTASVDSALEYLDAQLPKLDVLLLLDSANKLREEPRRIDLSAADSMSVASAAKRLLEQLCRYQDTERGRRDPDLPN